MFIYHLLLESFSHQFSLMVSHWSLCDSKSPQVSRNFFSILAVLNNAGVKMVSSRSPTSKFSSPFNNSLVTVPKEPITIGIIVTFMFLSFFISLENPQINSKQLQLLLILLLLIIIIIRVIIIVIIITAVTLKGRKGNKENMDIKSYRGKYIRIIEDISYIK